MKKEDVNRILGIQEAYQMPNRLMEILNEPKEKEKIFDEFLSLEEDMGVDWFNEYFQENQSDRKSLKQDFTPMCIGKILKGYVSEFENCADICAGTGGLTINMWNSNKDAFYYCEEVAESTIPILILNLSIRNIEGQIVNCNAISGEVKTVYTLHKGKKYSSINTDEEQVTYKFDCVITNPPYSLKYDRDKYIEDIRFSKYGVPPSSKADYCFVLHGLSKLNDNGSLMAILPHGVLFRGSHEETIRKNLIENNLINSIVGLPGNMFVNTSIPTLILELKKDRKENDVLIVDASEQYEKNGKYNVMQEEHIKRVIDVIGRRNNIEKFSEVVSFEKIKENDFNLNIPRYVCKFEAEPVPDILETIKAITEIDKQIAECECNLLEMMKQLVGTDEKTEIEHKKAIDIFENQVKRKKSKNNQLYGQLSLKLE